MTIEDLLDAGYVVSLIRQVDGRYGAMARHYRETTADVVGHFDTVGGVELIKSTPGRPRQMADGENPSEALGQLLRQMDQ